MSTSGNVSSLSNQQIQLVVDELNQVMLDHEDWCKTLLRTLVSRLPPKEEDLLADSHRHCRFGKWHESPDAMYIKEFPAYISLGEAHRRMHSCARTLLERVSNDLPIPVSEWDQFENHLESMRQEFNALHSEFSDLLHNRDPLTEAQNRPSMLPFIREQHALVKRGQQSCTLAMLDLDLFKRVNDEYGHAAGDQVLRSIARCLMKQLRRNDRLFRYGGEEFLICMPSTAVKEGAQAVERMRASIEQLHIELPDSKQAIAITVSAGVAPLKADQRAEESIEDADQTMYAAKKKGRNRVEVLS